MPVSAVPLLARHSPPLILAVLVCLSVILGSLGSAALKTVLISMLINLILVVGLYIFIGNSGVFSFGHIGFMAIGAYTTAAFRIPPHTKQALFPALPDVQLAMLPATLLGGAAAAVVAFVIAVPLMRLSGLVASLGTFAFLNITFTLASSLEITGGSTGLAGVPATTTLATGLVWALLAIAAAWAFQRTRVCLRLRASREDEAAAMAVGIAITGERTSAFVLSAFVTGIGGALFAQAFSTFNPSAFFVATTFATVAMLVVGGRLSLSGAVLGTVFISLLANVLRQMESGAAIGPLDLPDLRGLQQVGIGVATLLVLLLRPRGVTGGEEITWTGLSGSARSAGLAAARFRERRAARQASPRREPVAGSALPRLRTLRARGPGAMTGPIAADGSRPSSGPHDSAPTAATLLFVANLTVQYGGVAALRGVGLEVGTGEIVGLIGPNGAGKSTTLGAIAGFLSPTAGSVAFEGRSLLGDPPEAIVRRGIALVPEGRQILGTLSVAENLQLGATPLRDRRTSEQGLEEVLERFPILRKYYRSSAGKLSGGEQQQLAIARALLARPRLLLLDEPSLGLAPMMIDVVFEVLAELRDDGVTILLVEQNAAVAVELADRAYVLRAGQVVHSGTRDELLASTDFAAAYLGAQ